MSLSPATLRFATFLRSKDGKQFVKELQMGKIDEIFDFKSVKLLKLRRDGKPRVLKHKPVPL